MNSVDKFLELAKIPDELLDPQAVQDASDFVTGTMQGYDLTQEWQIIGALVKRLGGRVEIDSSELASVKGIIGMNGVGGKMILDAE